MEDLKEVLKDLTYVDIVYVEEGGNWYFSKPENIETVEYTRDEILVPVKAEVTADPKKSKDEGK